MSIRLRHPVPGAPRGNRYGPRPPIYIDGKWTPGFHNGQDFPAPGGTPILAAADGTVGYAGWVTTGGGNWTRIDHAGNWKTHYGHQSRIAVRPGQRVKAGQVIGYVGTTGMSTGNHLHFELSLGTVRRDPWPYITTSAAPKKGLSVIHYTRKDKHSEMGVGRTLRGGDRIYLNEVDGRAAGATNIIGGTGPYSITPHVYANGEPGDAIELTLVWQNTRSNPRRNSNHYTERLVFDDDGLIRASREFKRAVASGYAVYVRVRAADDNKGLCRITLLRSDAYLIK